MAKRTTLQVCGGPVQVIIRQIGDPLGYECEYDGASQYNRADNPRYLMTSGRGETEQEAIRAYVADVHKREALPLGTLHS